MQLIILYSGVYRVRHHNRVNGSRYCFCRHLPGQHCIRQGTSLAQEDFLSSADRHLLSPFQELCPNAAGSIDGLYWYRTRLHLGNIYTSKSGRNWLMESMTKELIMFVFVCLFGCCF